MVATARCPDVHPGPGVRGMKRYSRHLNLPRRGRREAHYRVQSVRVTFSINRHCQAYRKAFIYHKLHRAAQTCRRRNAVIGPSTIMLLTSNDKRKTCTFRIKQSSTELWYTHQLHFYQQLNLSQIYLSKSQMLCPKGAKMMYIFVIDNFIFLG